MVLKILEKTFKDKIETGLNFNYNTDNTVNPINKLIKSLLAQGVGHFENDNNNQKDNLKIVNNKSSK